MGPVICLSVLLRDKTWISSAAVTFFLPIPMCVVPLVSFPFSPFLSVSFIQRAVLEAVLGRLLTQEKRAFNVMSLCRKAWQSRGQGHHLKEINTSPSSFLECNGLDITSPVGHYGSWIINPSYRVCVWVSVYVYVCLNEHRLCTSVCLLMYERCRCVFVRFSGGFTCTVWDNLSPRVKVIHYLYTLSAGSGQAARKSQLHKPLPSPVLPPPSLATGDNGPNWLLTVVFQGLPLASGWVWEGTAT